MLFSNGASFLLVVSADADPGPRFPGAIGSPQFWLGAGAGAGEGRTFSTL
jgi:hypothetical protein